MRLIDADELLKNDIGRIMGFRECDIKNAPTVNAIPTSVLDKIRAEIENINLNEVAIKYENRFYGFQQETLAIIDKYKTESEK